MKTFALVIATTFVFLQMPARASANHPTQRCRVYDDTSFNGLPRQCRTILPCYPRKLYVFSSRAPSYHYYPNYYCPYPQCVEAADRLYQAGRSKHWMKVNDRQHPAMSRVI